LAKAILKVLDTEWDREYAKQFTWDKVAEETLDIYDEVLSE